MINKFLAKVVERPVITLVAALILSAIFAVFARRVEFSSATDTFFVENDPRKAFYEKAKKLFGHDGVTVIAMVSPEGEDLFTRERLLKLKRVTEELEAIPGVRKVVSLANVDRIYGSGMAIHVKPLIPEIPETPEQWRALRSAIKENPMYERNLISRDHRTAAINVFLEDFDKDERKYYEIMDRISEVLNREAGPEKFYVAGIAATSTETYRAMLRDFKRFLPLTFLLIILILAVSFRTVWGVALPLSTVALAALWTVGFMGMFQIPFSTVTVLLPPLIVAIGNAYAIHVMNEYLEEADPSEPVSETVLSAARKVALPLVICGITTMVGFGSLGVNHIPSIRQLGLASVAGVFFAIVLSLTVLPAALVLVSGIQPSRGVDAEDESAFTVSSMLDEFLDFLSGLVLRHRVLLLSLSIFAGFAGLLLSFRMKVDTDFLSFFKKDSPITVANQVQQKYLAGAAPFFVVVEGKEPEDLKNPDLLRRMELFQNWMTSEVEGIDLTLSITDYIKLLNKVFHKNDPAYYRIPDTRREVAQLFLFYSFSGDPQDFAPYVTPDYKIANIMVRSRIVGSTETEEAVEKIENYGRWLFGDRAEVQVTGTIRMVNTSANEVARGQLKGIIICLAAIFVIMSFLFMSVRVGFLAMLPNILPVLVLFGVMGLFGLPLNFSTSLIACIAIGLGVDDTIHIVSRYNDELKTTLDPDFALKRTIMSVGKAVIYTSVSLFFGFSIIAVSEFVPIQQFGILTGMTIVVCLFADLIMTPALLTTVRIRTLWDYVNLKRSRQSSAQVRIFQGLTENQAKVATLMNVFGFYSPGDLVLRKGEMMSDLFVVLEGSVLATRGEESDASGEEEIPEEMRIGQGSHFGCFPGDPPRPAERDYVAEAPTRILILNQMSIERLRNTHPAIAKKLTENLEREKQAGVTIKRAV